MSDSRLSAIARSLPCRAAGGAPWWRPLSGLAFALLAVAWMAVVVLVVPAAPVGAAPALPLQAVGPDAGSSPAPFRPWLTGSPIADPNPDPAAADGPEPASRQARLASGAAFAGLFDRALAASRDGQFALALPLWDQVLELQPEDAAAWSNRGNVRLALGDAEGAIADQGQAMALDPDQPDPHLNRGTAEEALGRWTDAARDYDWILERNPKDASALYNLGNVQGSQGDWAAARESFAAAALARPGFAMARSSAALAAFQLADLQAAEGELRSLIRRYPLFADARAALTALLWTRGAAGEAESNWAAASGLDPRYRQAEWLLEIRRWPPQPVQALGQFLSLDAAPARNAPT